MIDDSSHGKKNFTLTPKELLLRYLYYLPWVILSLGLALTLAWVKLRYTTPIYSVSGKLLVNERNPYGQSGDKFANILELPDNSNNLNNEIQVIKSSTMAMRVVRKLELQKQYAIKGNIRTSQSHSTDLPFQWLIETAGDSAKSKSYLITIVSDNKFTIGEKTDEYSFGQQVKTGDMVFRLLPFSSIPTTEIGKQFLLSWYNENDVAWGFTYAINLGILEGTSVLNVNYNTENIKNGLDIVNQYMKEYQQSSFEDKKQIAFNTLEFIDDQLDTLQRELGGVERNLQKFREDNRIVNAELQSEKAYSEYNDSQSRMNELQVKMKIISYLKNYITDPINTHKLVPSNLGIEEPSLIQQINNFNELQLQREVALKSTTTQNPLVVSLETGIEKIRQDITQNLENVRNAIGLSYNSLASVSEKADQSFRSLPSKEKQLLEVTRRQAILQELYSFLLQKKLETAISSASTISDIKILEPASTNGIVSPNKKSIYLLAILLGLGIPAAIVFLIELLNDKVSGRADITKVTDIPILGEVGHVEDDVQSLIVKDNNRSYIAEQFRIIRSNLQYILPKNEKPVILVTSSFSGEGKSFISTNLGAVLALSGKKTVILEMDIRKPKILKGLGMLERRGISNYIVSDMRLEDILHPVPDVEGLYVVPCGPVPPNPAEMLLDERVEELFVELRKKFDAIVIDSAPVGLVSDAMSLGVHANASIYIVRHNYTLKKQVEMIDAIYKEKKLPLVSVVINDVTIKSGYGSYYGYGYGYGYGTRNNMNDYFHEKAGSMPNRFFKLFSLGRKK
ncbi:polysaccharide biosynthesis tyrosine autokinase [Flavihumibacter sp. ZG627]|uniref:GumC family protein n=1 Tax=Flavihumibacter sp. ZG627 TaxID=1463156 RepID=UPI00057DC86A|nr:polysaccharide biosynthesis tyrosine autokinase [Flavihumibacter sp. ZG627]KIC92259.1 hypothetical protein HY58_01515 [Flavihumibacter sp. ZG627]